MNIYWDQAHSARGPCHESPPLRSHENQPPPGPFPPVTLPSRALAAGPTEPSYKWRPRGDGGGGCSGPHVETAQPPGHSLRPGGRRARGTEAWASRLRPPLQLSFQRKVGILYCRAGQGSEEEMYNNQEAGPAFMQFLTLLGDVVRLKGFESYRAQLDTKSEARGLGSGGRQPW